MLVGDLVGVRYSEPENPYVRESAVCSTTAAMRVTGAMGVAGAVVFCLASLGSLPVDRLGQTAYCAAITLYATSSHFAFSF